MTRVAKSQFRIVAQLVLVGMLATSPVFGIEGWFRSAATWIDNNILHPWWPAGGGGGGAFDDTPRNGGGGGGF